MTKICEVTPDFQGHGQMLPDNKKKLLDYTNHLISGPDESELTSAARRATFFAALCIT